MISNIQARAEPAPIVKQLSESSSAPQPVVKAAVESAHVEIKVPAKPEIQINSEQSRKNLQEAIQQINDLIRDGGRGLNFSVDEKLGRMVIYVKNLDSGEVIRQIPTEAVMNFAHNLEDLKGLLHNASV